MKNIQITDEAHQKLIAIKYSKNPIPSFAEVLNEIMEGYQK